MIHRNNLLRAAVAAAFGVAAGQAMAVVNINASTAAPAKFAREIPSTTIALANVAGALGIQFTAPAGYSIAASSPLYVKLFLSTGSSFKGTPNIACSTATSAANGDGIQGSITVGGAGDSAVTFNIGAATAATIAGSAQCWVSGFTGIGIVSGSTRPNVTVSAQIEYKNGLTDAVTGSNGTLVTYVTAIGGVYASGGAVVVDATSGSDNFSAGGGAQSTSLALLGNIALTAVTAASTALGGGNATDGDLLTVGSVTITSPALAAALAIQGVSGVFLDASTGSICDNKTYKVDSTGLNSVTFTGVTTAELAAGLGVCMSVSGGTTQIATGTTVGFITGTLVANVASNIASGSLVTLTQNGTTKNAYLVNSSSSASKTSVIRIVNTGGNSGVIRATAYLVGDGVTGTAPNVDGTQVGTANATIATLAANQSLSLTSAQLEALLGYTPASGTAKYRVVFSAGLAGFKVLNYTKDVVGGYITISQQQDD